MTTKKIPTPLEALQGYVKDKPSPAKNVSTAIEYISETYGDDMTYWDREEHPGNLPMNEREAWHRDAWDREQVALGLMTSGQAGNDAPGRPRNFGYANPGTVHEQ